MSGGTTLARKAKVSQDGKSVKLDKTEWHKTLDLIKNYKVNLDKLVKDNKKLSKENTTFTEIYDSCVLSALSGRRQYIQTRCLEDAKGA